MPDPGSVAEASATQAYRSSALSRGTTASRSDARASDPRRVTVSAPSWAATSAVTRSLAVAVVASTGVPGREVRAASGQPLVVGPEVEAPVGDAVRLVDDQQPALARAGPAAGGRTTGWTAARVRSAARRSRPHRMSASTSSQSSTLVELTVAARSPARPAAAIWSRIRASSGETTSVGPPPAARSAAVAAQ